jgi:protoporphyrinogen oxidase
MSDIFIVGGGLTGLAAAWELERLGARYTLIEVKPRLGGSIYTERRDGFVLDGGAFALEKYGDWAFLDELGLGDALVTIGKYRDGELVIFRDGTQRLTDVSAQCLTNPILRRMAVSSVGVIGNRYGVCLENGIMMDASALIITAPARYAEHMLRALAPEAALRLLDYQYDPVARVSLGYRKQDVTELKRSATEASAALKFVQLYDMPERVPPDHVLVRAGVRVEGEPDKEALIRTVRSCVGDADPVMEWVYYWAEADPLTRYLPEHEDNMDAIERLLPETVALVGSDYRARRLDQQVEQGRAAARRIVEKLR